MPEQHTEFAVVLNARDDWDQNMGGWRCSALAIPAAEVQKILREGKEVDSAEYKVETKLRLIRWSGVSRPDLVAVVIRLSKELEEREVSVRWKKLTVIVPIITAAITAFGAYAAKTCEKPPPCPKVEWEEWQFDGQVTLSEHVPSDKVKVALVPPDLRVFPDGKLQLPSVPVKIDENGRRRFPSLIFWEIGGGFRAPSPVHIPDDPKGAGTFAGTADYSAKPNYESKIVRIETPIEYTPLKPKDAAKPGYDPSRAVTPEPNPDFQLPVRN